MAAGTVDNDKNASSTPTSGNASRDEAEDAYRNAAQASRFQASPGDDGGGITPTRQSVMFQDDRDHAGNFNGPCEFRTWLTTPSRSLGMSQEPDQETKETATRDDGTHRRSAQPATTEGSHLPIKPPADNHNTHSSPTKPLSSSLSSSSSYKPASACHVDPTLPTRSNTANAPRPATAVPSSPPDLCQLSDRVSRAARPTHQFACFLRNTDGLDRMLIIRQGSRPLADGSVELWPALMVYTVPTEVDPRTNRVRLALHRGHHTAELEPGLLWWQFDPAQQTLYVLRKTSSLLEGDVQLVAYVCKQDVLIPAFVVSLALPEVVSALDSSRMLDLPLSLGCHWQDVHLQVVRLDDGAVCLCYQVLTIPADKDELNESTGEYANVTEQLRMQPPLAQRNGMEGNPSASPLPTRAALESWRTDQQGESSTNPLVDDDLPPDLVYSVVLLHWSSVVALSVPCPPIARAKATTTKDGDADLLRQPRLSFFALGDQLGVHLTDWWLDLLDVGAEHEPMVSLRLGNANHGYDREVVPMWTPTAIGLLDLQTHQASQTSLDLLAVQELVTSPHEGQVRAAAVHLLIVHLRRENMVFQLMEHLRYHTCWLLDTMLLQEVLLASSYTSVRHHGSTGAALRRHLPLTGLAPCHTAQQSHVIYTDCSLQEQLHPDFGRGLLVPQGLARHIQRVNFAKAVVKPASSKRTRPSSRNGVTPSRSRERMDAPAAKPTFGDRFVNFLSGNSSPNQLPASHEQRARTRSSGSRASSTTSVTSVTETLAQAVHTDEGDGRGRWHAEALLRHAATTNDDRQRFAPLALEYQEAMLMKATMLADLFAPEELLASLDEPGFDRSATGVAFEACERLYFVLQSLSFPFPNGFHDKLLRLGYMCLPRDLFLQYVDAGIIKLTVDFVLDRLREPVQDDEEDIFRAHLLCQSRLFSQLPLEVLEQWAVPVAQRLLLARKTSKYFNEFAYNVKLEHDELRTNPEESATLGLLQTPLISVLTYVGKQMTRLAAQQNHTGRSADELVALNLIKNIGLMGSSAHEMPLDALLPDN
eukprot:TRINITY_DN7801_c0_g1_i1.p1 TRINITY_DN7801_c0_g1~~TRINITY_DN7801_c0_g1_i1.p1  ORF type:complete len:1197 (+),score=278.63 TRINITY_DN7801_c0_g1_i1:461-3592(+)